MTGLLAQTNAYIRDAEQQHRDLKARQDQGSASHPVDRPAPPGVGGNEPQGMKAGSDLLRGAPGRDPDPGQPDHRDADQVANIKVRSESRS